MIVQGGLITVPTPASNAITTTIGVNTPFVPFSINATTPANLQIYVFGTTTASGTFEPVTDIDPDHGRRQRRRVPQRHAHARPQPGRLGQRHPGRHHHDHAAILAEPHGRHPDDHDQRPDPRHLAAGRRDLDRLGQRHGHRLELRRRRQLDVACSPRPRAGPCWRRPSTRPSAPPSTSPRSRSSRRTTTPRSRCPSPCSSTSPTAGFNERLYAYNHNGKHLKNYLTIRGPAATGIWGPGGSPAPADS